MIIGDGNYIFHVFTALSNKVLFGNQQFHQKLRQTLVITFIESNQNCKTLDFNKNFEKHCYDMYNNGVYAGLHLGNRLRRAK